MRRLRNLSVNIGLMSLALVVGLVSSEVALRWLVPGQMHYYVIRPGIHKVLEPDPVRMPGVHGPVHYDINSQGVRGPELATESAAYRILAIGGSTTELLYIDQPRSWPALVEQSLPRTLSGAAVWVGNVGRSGMNARDHVVHVKYLSTEYPRLAQLVVLVGVNDLTVALHDSERYVLPPPITDPAAEQQQIRRAFQVVPDSLARLAMDERRAAGAPWYMATAVAQLVDRARTALRDRRSSEGLVEDPQGRALARWQENRKRAPRIIDTLPSLAAPLVEYRRNLNAIVDLAEAQHLRVLFLTQPALWRADLTSSEQNRLWLGGIGNFQAEAGHEYYSAAALAEGMRRYNEALLDVCRHRRVDCLDLDVRVPKNTTMFYDDVHFTDLGSTVVARELTDFLRRRPPFAAPADASGG